MSIKRLISFGVETMFTNFAELVETIEVRNLGVRKYDPATGSYEEPTEEPSEGDDESTGDIPIALSVIWVNADTEDYRYIYSGRDNRITGDSEAAAEVLCVLRTKDYNSIRVEQKLTRKLDGTRWQILKYPKDPTNTVYFLELRKIE